MNRIDKAFEEKGSGLLNVYFTAGFPELESTLSIAECLEEAGADLIELGIPYSDPIADGPTIQRSSTRALESGMSIKLLFEQLSELRKHVSVPVILMGYLNPVVQYGVEAFCEKCQEVGIDGLILPDLPMHEYVEVYKPIFDQHGLYNICLITPQTSVDRIREIDEQTNGFIYMVSSSSITGAKQSVSDGQLEYFARVDQMNLKSKRLIGFGISNKPTFDHACQHSDGAIIGSAFIKQLEEDASPNAIKAFIKSIKQ
ncbi:MAG: tryptophan synthase subunit alpha [Cyclobacteriaceae bacterium]